MSFDEADDKYRRALRDLIQPVAEKLSRKTIRYLRQIDPGDSWVDTSQELNLWDLICLDKEFSDIGLYEYYDEMITNIVEGYVGELPSAEKVALWLQTDEAMEWLYPEGGQESSEKPDPDPNAIARYIKDEFVYPEVSANPSRRAGLVYERDISPGH
ncbi:hypothetical protein [Roseibium sediminis]|uniref:hypothetical protein n=1 Tax=Roseibium sediminis TaxID=1775174 RepID=UPI00123D4564|nr:hypothetical protein [Roseibium sediminis]